MTTYRLFPSASGPAAPVNFSGSFISAVCFAVQGGGNWLDGYWWWVGNSGSPAQSTSPVKCALWSVNSASTFAASFVVPGSVVTSGTLTAGAWNYIPLTSPVQLAPSWDTNLTTSGSVYIAAIGCNGPFPDTGGFWGSGGPGASGIANGPLVAFGGIGAGSTGLNEPPYNIPQGLFTTGGSDPSVTIPLQQSTVDNFWVDVQVDTNAPPGYSGSYRLWPNKADTNNLTTGDAAFNYTVATEVSLTQPCTLSNVWYFSPHTATTLATRAEVWSVSTGLSVASISSPSWLTASGTAYSPGAGAWVKAAFAANTTLPPGDYRVSVYNANGTTDANWSAKDGVSDYWAETYTGAGAGGITWGPLYAPDYPHAAAGYLYGGPSTATPPYSNGTVPHAQPVFGQTGSGVTEFPNLYAPVGTGNNQTQNYWVDLEVIPQSTAISLTDSGMGADTLSIVVSSNAPQIDAAALGGSILGDYYGGSVSV